MNSIKKGYQLSDVDVIVANHINELPTSYVHVNRWFKHVTNQEDKPSEIAKLPKNVKSDLLAHFGSLFSSHSIYTDYRLIRNNGKFPLKVAFFFQKEGFIFQISKSPPKNISKNYPELEI